MTEQQLISKIRELRQFKPRQDWVVLVKKQIFEHDERNRVPFVKGTRFLLGRFLLGEKFVFQHKPAFAFITTFLVLIGVFGFAQNSLPGETLFSLKKLAEQSQTIFILEKEQPKHNLELVNKRLDDLTKIAQTNVVKNLAPAINEFQASVSKAAESLAKTDTKKNPQVVKAIALEVKKLAEKTEKIKSLGVEIGENQEWDNALAQIVEREIEDLEEKTLTEEQQEALIKVRSDYEAGNYSQAIEKILLLTNN